MTLLDAIKNRHAVRAFTDQPIADDVKAQLNQFISQCNALGNLHMQLVLNEPKAFSIMMARYGKFKNANNYVALVGKKLQEEACGYYGEKVALFAQQLGLNSCWVGQSYGKTSGAFTIADDEKLFCVIAIGYGQTQGVPHKSKSFFDVVVNGGTDFPEWFRNGVEAALLAPTAMNRQKFKFSLKDRTVLAKAGLGFYTKIDLGIVKCHFEIGAGFEIFEWAK